MYIRSITELKEKKEAKKEQLDEMKTRLYADYLEISFTTEKVKEQFSWLGKVVWMVQSYKQLKGIFSRFKKVN